MLYKHSIVRFLAVGLLLIGSKSTYAQSAASHPALSDSTITQVSFKPPPNNRQPRKTAGAGSRQESECFSQTPLSSPPLMALVPTDNHGLTVAAHPSFFIYLPSTTAKHLILSIRENGTQHLSRTDLSINQTSGIIQIKPTENSPPLEVGKTYQWSMVIVCGEKPSPNDPSVSSWIQRIDIPLTQLDHKTALQKAFWYGEQGIWYDTLLALAQAQQVLPNPPKITSIWTNFLTSVGLDAIANQPLLPSIRVP